MFSFKQNAWADTTTFVEWVERTLSKAVADDDRFCLFCNNLKKQYRNLGVLFGTDYPQHQIYGSQLMLVMHNSLSPSLFKLKDGGWMMKTMQRSGTATIRVFIIIIIIIIIIPPIPSWYIVM